MTEFLTHLEANIPEGVKIPEFGEVPVTDVINTEGCIDPRDSKKRGDFVEDIEFTELNENIIRVPHDEKVPHEPHDERGAKFPGASLGHAMALYAAAPEIAGKKITPQQAVDLVTEWEESEGRKYTHHEADHRGPKEIGCAHVDKASQEENEELYDISSEAVKTMRDYVKEKFKQGKKKAEVPVLTGDHNEEGLIIVLNKEKDPKPKTVGTTDDKGNKFFRYDVTLHMESLERLAEFVQEKGIRVEAKNIKAKAKKQVDATFGLVAAEKPIFAANFQGEKLFVSRIGSVPTLPQRA